MHHRKLYNGIYYTCHILKYIVHIHAVCMFHILSYLITGPWPIVGSSFAVNPKCMDQEGWHMWLSWRMHPKIATFTISTCTMSFETQILHVYIRQCNHRHTQYVRKKTLHQQIPTYWVLALLGFSEHIQLDQLKTMAPRHGSLASASQNRIPGRSARGCCFCLSEGH